MAQQTAVDSLWDSLTCLFFFQDGIPVEAMEIYDQAKQMEKEQIEDAYIMGSYDMASKEFKPEQYYNETYGED
jgi:hypothetical protein